MQPYELSSPPGPMFGYEVRYHPHVHTRFSDGHGTYRDVLHAAARAGLHAVEITDHNVRPKGLAGYHWVGQRRVLLLVGEEIHDRTLLKGKNHLLALGIRQDLSPLAEGHPQRLINGVVDHGGLAFIAHPVDVAVPYAGEGDFSWRDWDIRGFHGIELWNAMSEFKARIPTPVHALFYAFAFHRVARGPFVDTLRLWDRLLQRGLRVTAIGGSDAHALPARLGPLRRTLFPYEWHFRAINTHILLAEPLRGDFDYDRALLYRALAQGRAFVGYDLPAATEGFRFWVEGRAGVGHMGAPFPLEGEVTLHIRVPRPARVTLIHNGNVVQSWQKARRLQVPVHRPGVYRVEVYLWAWGRWRGWIFSNPVYLHPT